MTKRKRTDVDLSSATPLLATAILGKVLVNLVSDLDKRLTRIERQAKPKRPSKPRTRTEHITEGG